MEKNRKPNQGITIFLITCTMLLSLALFGCGIYSLYISIGFRFLNRSAVSGLNTAALYTYPNSSYGTGSGTMVGLILISIVMLGLGIGMVIIFIKQLPLYKQIRFIAKMPNVKYKEYSAQAKKSVIVYSIIGYIVCIAFSVFAIIVVFRSGISANYLWIVATAFFVVLGLSIASMVLMFVKIAQLSKIRQRLKANDQKEELKKEVESEQESINQEKQEESEEIVEEKDEEPIIVQTIPEVEPISQITAEGPKETIAERLFTDGIFELGDQLTKLREIHVSGLISNEEYTALREKWIDAVLREPLFGKSRTRKNKAKKTIVKPNIVIEEN